MPAPTPIPGPFASDVNYPAGGAPWNGTATKVAMDAGELAAGWAPNYRPPAQKLNWLLWWLTTVALYLLGCNFDSDVQALGFMTTIYSSWVPGHAYVIGNRVMQPDGLIYECTVAGTSDDGSGGHTGPSGTGGAIVDNTATWKYVGYTGYRHGTMVRDINPAEGINDSDNAWTPDVANGFMGSLGVGNLVVPLSFDVGKRITSVTFEIGGDGVADLAGSIKSRRKNAAPGAALFTFSSVNPTGYTDVVCSLAGSEWTFKDGDYVWINFHASAANLKLGTVRVSYDYLPPP